VSDVREAITQAHHEEWARVVAALTRRFGNLDIAEEAAAEAFATAVERWPADGVPPNPGAWLTTTSKRKAIDRIRREIKGDFKQKEAQLLYNDDQSEPLDAIGDERLQLIFTCCHPALSMENRVALTLRMVGRLTVPEIARAFLVEETAMGQRITRAKTKIRAARIPYRVPSAEDLPARITGVLAVLFLVFNEGYLATGPDTDPVRHDLTAEAIRLTRLVRALMPEDGEVAGLLALMLLTEALRTARVSASRGWCSNWRMTSVRLGRHCRASGRGGRTCGCSSRPFDRIYSLSIGTTETIHKPSSRRSGMRPGGVTARKPKRTTKRPKKVLNHAKRRGIGRSRSSRNCSSSGVAR
jgi:RNA polymerase sigma-70 factor (ECF subfamily)